MQHMQPVIDVRPDTIHLAMCDFPTPVLARKQVS